MTTEPGETQVEGGVLVPTRDASIFVERAGRGTPVLVLHGFTGTTRSLEPLASSLEENHDVIRIDLIGHGRSGAPREVGPYAMERCVAQVVDVLDALGVDRTHVLGYSMGGRVALALGCSDPERFASALLVGASAGLESTALRSERGTADRALADRIEGEGLEAFVDHWMALPLFATQRCLGEEALTAARAERLQQRPLGLANSLRGMGTGAQPPLHAHLANLRAPVCLVAGELDAKFRAIAVDLASRLPNARTALIGAAGHAAHLEKPEDVLRIARGFFREVDGTHVEAAPRIAPSPGPNPAAP